MGAPLFPSTVCKTKDSAQSQGDANPPIESLASLNKYEGCTEISGNLIINIRGSLGSGVISKLTEINDFMTE